MTATLAGSPLAGYAALAVVAASFAASKKTRITTLRIENAQKKIARPLQIGRITTWS